MILPVHIMLKCMATKEGKQRAHFTFHFHPKINFFSVRALGSNSDPKLLTTLNKLKLDISYFESVMKAAITVAL